MITVDEMWEQFRSSVISPTAPEVQLREMKMAFFGGASSILLTLRAMVENMPDAIAVVTVEGWTIECAAYTASLRADDEEQQPLH